MATPAGTERYAERFADDFAPRYFQTVDGCTVSSVGAGTYLGDPTDDDDERYRNALITALESGINVIDTAINYRCQRSERVVGRAVEEAATPRDEVFVATKGGYLPFDRDPPVDVDGYVRDHYVDPGLVDPEELGEGLHCMTPDFLDDQLDRSLANLGMDAVDCYYVHNPEAQLTIHSREEVYDRIEAAFTRLEERAAAGDLRSYGLATWTAFRVPDDDDTFLSLYEVLSRAEAAAGAAGNDENHFRAVQLPFNPLMAEAFTVRSHEARGDVEIPNVLSVARDAGLAVFTSATLAQGRIIEEMPDEVGVWFEGDTVVQRAINFARSAPGVTCALVGSRSPAHVVENADAGTFDRMGGDAFDVVFEGPAEAEEGGARDQDQGQEPGPGPDMGPGPGI